ncbi:hypothetical protein ACWEVP_48465 [Amycolatopsis sp. NPDC003865]
MEKFGTWVRALLTFALLIGVALWLVEVAGTIGIPVVKSSDGTVFDQFQRAKDVLAVITPLLTTALGYWFGSAGRQEAQTTASAARAEADQAHRRLAGVLDSSSEPGLLAKARAADPEAFGVAPASGESSQPAEEPPPAPAGSTRRRARWWRM